MEGLHNISCNNCTIISLLLIYIMLRTISYIKHVSFQNALSVIILNMKLLGISAICPWLNMCTKWVQSSQRKNIWAFIFALFSYRYSVRGYMHHTTFCITAVNWTVTIVLGKTLHGITRAHISGCVIAGCCCNKLPHIYQLKII